MSLNWTAPQGISRTEPVTLRDRTGAVFTGYTGVEPLVCTAWPGDDRAASATLPAAWQDPAAGLILVTIPGAATMSMERGTYRWLLTIADMSAELARGTLEITGAPGLATARPTYGTAQMMEDECSWIGTIQNTSRDQAGFAEQRGQAREWLDGLILGASPVGLRWLGSGSLGMGMGTTIPGPWSYGSTATMGWPAWWFGTSLMSDSWLVDLLAGGGLVLTSARGKAAVRACSCYAIALVLRGQIGPGSDFGKFAAFFMRRAQSEASTLVAEIDTNGDGKADLAIPLSVTNTRYA